MRIVQVNISANHGSTGRIAEQIGLAVMSQGWESFFAYGHLNNGSKSIPIHIGSRVAMLIHALCSRLFDAHGLFSVRATKKFLIKLESLRPDIVHLHNIHGYYLNYKLLFEWLQTRQIPVIWTLHDCWSFTGHCAHFVRFNCNKWRLGEGCKHCPALHEYPSSWAIDRSARNYSLKQQLFGGYIKRITVVPVSNWLESFVRESFLQKASIRIIHNGIDINVFRPSPDVDAIRRRYNCTGKTVILGVAMPWSDKKGWSDFVRLASILPLDQYQIVMVGVSPVQKRELPSSILAIERTHNQQELVELYSMADILFNATHEDNYPTVNLEAIACGTPVLTYKTGGSPESITSQTGFVVDKGDLDNAIGIIRGFKKNENISKACRTYAVRHFDQSIVFHSYISLYREILGLEKK